MCVNTGATAASARQTQAMIVSWQQRWKAWNGGHHVAPQAVNGSCSCLFPKQHNSSASQMRPFSVSLCSSAGDAAHISSTGNKGSIPPLREGFPRSH